MLITTVTWLKAMRRQVSHLSVVFPSYLIRRLNLLSQFITLTRAIDILGLAVKTPDIVTLLGIHGVRTFSRESTCYHLLII